MSTPSGHVSAAYSISQHKRDAWSDTWGRLQWVYLYRISGPAGAVYWGPCHEAVAEAVKEAETFETFSYNFDHGLPVLREELRKKIRDKNGLHGVSRRVCISHFAPPVEVEAPPYMQTLHHCPFLAYLYHA